MSNEVSESEQIHFLVLRKFPNAENVESAYCKPKPITPIRGNNARNERVFAELELTFKRIQDYRREISSTPPEELMAFFLQERAKAEEEVKLKIEREEKARPFNQPYADADFEFWSRAKHWTLDEAIALSFGKAPSVVNWSSVCPFLAQGSAFAVNYSRLRELAIRAQQWKELFDPVLPGIFIGWTKRLKLEFPKELEEKVIYYGGHIVDWKARYDSLEELFNVSRANSDELYKKAMEVLDKKNADIVKLTKANSELVEKIMEAEKNKKIAADKPLKTTERNKLLMLSYGMAKSWYGYDPKKARSETIPEIINDLEKSGVTMDDETIRKYLRLGAELFPQEPDES